MRWSVRSVSVATMALMRRSKTPPAFAG